MAQNSQPPAPALDSGTRLAVDRTFLAHERTLMAWVRTATSLISLGFTIYKFFEFDVGRSGRVTSGLLTPRQFGMAMIGTGLVALLMSTIEHRQSVKRMQAEFGFTRRSTSTVVGAIVSVMGLVAFLVAAFGE